jgi:hypothetical protein
MGRRGREEERVGKIDWSIKVKVITEIRIKN